VASFLTRLFSRRATIPPAEAPAPLRLPAEPPAPPQRIPPAHAAFRHLRTGRGNVLAADGDIIAMATPGAANALVAIIPDANQQLTFLMAPDLRPLSVRGDGLVSPAISAFRLQTGEPATLRLRHPLVPARFMAVTPPGLGSPDGIVIFDSPGTGPLDRFEAIRADPTALSPDFLQAAAELCAATARPFRAAPLLERARTLLLRPELAEAAIRLLPRDELAELARALLANQDDRELLRATMPANPWFSRVLPELAAWRARPGKLTGAVLHSPPADEFAGDPFEGHGQPQAGFAITALARATIRPRRGACLLTSVRNEGPYFLEWLAYHRSVGFEHAFIYTNDNSDGSNGLLEALANHGLITLVYNQPGTHAGPQYKMHGHALSLLPHILDYAWAALIDGDEFIAFDARRFRNIDDVIAWHETQPVDAIALCWHIFAASAADMWRDEPTIARFTRREPGVNAHVKTMFRPAKFWYSHAHYPHASLGMPFVFRAEDGTLHHHPAMLDRNPAFAPNPSANIAWVNHYWLRTAPEMLWKLARGHPDWKGEAAFRHLEMAQFMCRNFVQLSARTDLVDDTRIQACAAAMPGELAGLRALPGVAAAEARIRDEFAARLPHIVTAFLAAAPPDGNEPPEFPPFRSLLRALVETAPLRQAAS